MTTSPVMTLTDELLAELEEAARNADRAAWQFYSKGEWHTGMDENRHYENTVGAGYSVRDLYAHFNPATILALVERVRELEKDAARYRWAKDNASLIFDEEARFPAESGQIIYSTMPSRRELDAAIDAAMQEAPK